MFRFLRRAIVTPNWTLRRCGSARAKGETSDLSFQSSCPERPGEDCFRWSRGLQSERFNDKDRELGPSWVLLRAPAFVLTTYTGADWGSLETRLSSVSRIPLRGRTPCSSFFLHVQEQSFEVIRTSELDEDAPRSVVVFSKVPRNLIKSSRSRLIMCMHKTRYRCCLTMFFDR